MLRAEHISVQYGSVSILNDVSFTVGESEWLMIIGPNGAGKSTLVDAVSQGIPYGGRVLFEGRNLAEAGAGERARSIGVLAQKYQVSYSFTVEEIVRLGRYAYSKGLFAGGSDEDERMVEQALRDTGMWDLRRQSVLTLSGGELQRTFLAQVLAQDPRLLVLDEPTNHLDLVYQKQVFDLIRTWLRREGRAVVSVVHDLSLARAYGTHALLLGLGGVAACGPVEEILRGEVLNDVYRMDVPAWLRGMYGQWAENKS